MVVLVDFDNLSAKMRRVELTQLTSHVILKIAAAGHIDPTYEFRLYGGWYGGRALTRSAQSLSTDIQANFPSTINLPGGTPPTVSLVSVELALSLAADPKRDLFETFRTRPFGGRLTCDENVVSACSDPSCPLPSVSTFLANQKCTVTKCNVRQEDLLSRGEQKLVDTMLTADLLYLVNSGSPHIAVVSSDDDLWPGISTAIAFGASVVLVHTKQTRLLPISYTQGYGTVLKQIVI